MNRVDLDTPSVLFSLSSLQTRGQQRRAQRPLKTLTRARRAVMRKLATDLAQQGAQLGIQNRLDALADATGDGLEKYRRRLARLKEGR